ncbi:MAG: carotenoid oxygenase family protein, partial [Polyangiaceae bacterium]|nr:carotenoid oxygenase family protein [Polyangiaceae bacterium]
VLDARRARSHVAVFDAERLADGPIARAWFDEALPITFHGVFLGA